MINRKEHEKMKVENLKLRNIPDGWYTECGKLVKMRD